MYAALFDFSVPCPQTKILILCQNLTISRNLSITLTSGQKAIFRGGLKTCQMMLASWSTWFGQKP